MFFLIACTAIVQTRIGFYARLAARRAAAPQNGKGEEVPPKMSPHHNISKSGILSTDRDGCQFGFNARQTHVRQHDLAKVFHIKLNISIGYKQKRTT